MSFSNNKINLGQVDPFFSEKFSLTGYSSNSVDISNYLFSPYVDYINSSSNISFSPFKGIRAITVGAGGGGGGSGHDSNTVLYNNDVYFAYGGAGGGGGCGQIKHGIINDIFSTYGVNTFNVIVGTGGAGGAGGNQGNVGEGQKGGTGGNSCIKITASNNNIDYYPIFSLGGGGGEGGKAGTILTTYSGSTLTTVIGGGIGGSRGASFGWVNNSSYYCVDSTDGYSNGITFAPVGYNPSLLPAGPGGNPGYLNGWCNERILAAGFSTSDFGKGGQGGSIIVHSSYSTTQTFYLSDNGTVGTVGNGGFVRVYFINTISNTNSSGILNGDFSSSTTPSLTVSDGFNKVSNITNWTISGSTANSGVYICSGFSSFSPYGETSNTMTINKTFRRHIAIQVKRTADVVYISQILNLPFGNYKLSFYAWPRKELYSDTQELLIDINNSTIFSKTYTKNGGIILETVPFTVSTQSQTLKFFSGNNVAGDSSICIADISVYISSDVNYNLISDGSITSWKNFGITTSATIGNPAPSIQATTAGGYGYINVASIHPGFTTFLNSRLNFDIYTTTNSLVNLYFGCNSYGQGNMFRLDSRSGISSGIASTNTWTSWGAPTGELLQFTNSLWYRIEITISSTGLATYKYSNAFTTGFYTTPYQISNLGTFIGVQADGINGGYIDNIYINNATTEMIPPPVVPTSNTLTISNQSDKFSFKNGTYIMSSSSVYGGFEPYYAFNNSEADGSFWHCQGSGMITGYPTSSTAGIGAYTRDPYDSNGDFQGGNVFCFWQTNISGQLYAGEWLQIQLPYSFILTSHTYVHRFSYLWSNRGPKKFYVAGSNNGSVWFMLHQKEYTSSVHVGNAEDYIVSNNSTEYSYYRIIFNKVYGNLVNVSEWRLTGTIRDKSLDQTLVYYYKFNSEDNVGTTLANYATGIPVYDATLVNGATFDTATTKFGGGSLYLNGTNQYVSLPAFTSDSNGLSFSIWIKTNSAGWARIFDFGNGDGNNNILLSPQNGISSYNGTTAGDQPLYNTFVQNTGNWVHIAWTLESTNTANKTAASKIYINGSYVYYYSFTNFKFFPNAITRSLNYLGKSNFTGDPYFAGNMEEFRMYKRVLNATEISNLYTKNSLI